VIVIDASALVELLLNTTRASAVKLLIRKNAELHAPHLIDIEVLQCFRRYERLRLYSGEVLEQAARNLIEFPLVRHAHVPLIAGCWASRNNLSAYDAVYVTLAVMLKARLITCDSRIAGAGLKPGLVLVAGHPPKQ
jgi:predicted nucleic acid-binding protein